MIGKRRSEVIVEAAETRSFWVGIFGRIALYGGSKEFDQYSESTEGYVRVFVYSPEKGCFAVIMNDITQEMNEVQEKTIMMTAVNDIVFELNKDFVFVNIFTSDDSRLFLPREQILEKSVNDIFSREMSDILVAAMQKSVHSTKNESVIYRSPVPGEDKWYKANIYYREINKVPKFIASITQTSKQEEALSLREHDQLTGLYNRKYYEDTIHEIDKPGNLPITLVMADVNGLKMINNTYGYTAGDELLRLFAGVLKKECRETDIVARTGGSEFVILLPRTTLETAKKIVQRIKDELSAKETDKLPLSAAFSFGTKTKSNEMFEQIYKNMEEIIVQQKNQN